MNTMREDFPKMPDSIRSMMEEEVARQVRQRPERRGFFMKKRAGLVLLAAAVAAGGTAFAAASFGLTGERTGAYGLLTGLDGGEDGEGWTLPETIPERMVRFNVIPDGMGYPDEKTTWQLSYEGETSYAIGSALWVMDESANADRLESTYVSNSENLTIGEHSAVYIEYSNGKMPEIFVFYPDEYYTAQFFLNGISKDDAVSVLENVTLEETGETLTTADVYATWSRLVGTAEETMEDADAAAEKEYSISGEAMDAALAVGDAWTDDTLTIALTDVQVADDLSLLGDAAALDESFSSQVGEDGKLLDNTIEYVKRGDGVDTQDETVREETVAQKLLYLTFAYTNNGVGTAEDVLFYYNCFNLSEDGDSYVLVDNTTRALHGKAVDWDYTRQSSDAAASVEMGWFDVTGGADQNGSNYISSIEPGETVTLHVAFLVNEDQLDGLYIAIGGCGGDPYFGEGALQPSETIKIEYGAES